MRWPWQRSDERATDAAPGRAATDAAPDAAPRVPPAGWAFLPPLQRQLSDAPPVVLRPAFVASLPTRTVPASLGTMGHLVDAAAPGGTIAVDDAALGAPVQRAVAAELTLRPRQSAAPTVPAQRQSATDAAEPTPHDGSPDPTAVPDEHADVDPLPDLSTEVRDVDVAEQAPAASAETARVAGTPVARLVDDSFALRSTGSDAAAAQTPAIADASVESPSGDSPPHRNPHDATQPIDGPSAGNTAHGSPTTQESPTHASVVRPTLQRIASTAAGTGMPPSPGSPARRAGLGAPLPSRHVQRARSDGAPDPARHEAARPGAGASPPPAPPPALLDGFREPLSPALQRDVDDGAARLPADRRIPSVDAPTGSATQASPRPTPRHGVGVPEAMSGPMPLASAASPRVRTAAAAVQRQPEATAAWIPSSRSSLADPTPENPASSVPEDKDVVPTDAMPADGGPLDRTPPWHAETDATGESRVRVQRSVPLVAARRIVPALADSTLGSLPFTDGSRRVVVARVVAPSPPEAAVGGVGTPDAGSGSSGPAASPGSFPRTAEHEVAASVARLAIAPVPADVEGRPWAPPSTPTVALAESSAATGNPIGSRPASVQRLGGLPSLPRPPLDLPSIGQQPGLPSGLPSVGQLPTDLPSVEQLESRAAELASEGTDSLRSASDALTAPAEAASSAIQAAAAPGGGENVEQLVRKLYGPLVRRIKAELLLDRERRGIRIDGI